MAPRKMATVQWWSYERCNLSPPPRGKGGSEDNSLQKKRPLLKVLLHHTLNFNLAWHLVLSILKETHPRLFVVCNQYQNLAKSVVIKLEYFSSLSHKVAWDRAESKLSRRLYALIQFRRVRVYSSVISDVTLFRREKEYRLKSYRNKRVAFT